MVILAFNLECNSFRDALTTANGTSCSARCFSIRFLALNFVCVKSSSSINISLLIYLGRE